MSGTNVKTPGVRKPKGMVETVNHGGTTALKPTSAETELKFATASCYLWEDQFYESGVSIAQRIRDLALKIEPEKLAAMTIETRLTEGLRHVSLWMLCALVKSGARIPHLVQDTIAVVINRPDELTEFPAQYWKVNPRADGKKAPLTGQMKKGLARAALKFDQYQLTKWNRDKDINIRDIVFLTHPKPTNEKLFANFLNKDHYPKDLVRLGSFKALEAPKTWEVGLSEAGKTGENKEANKKEVWTNLLENGKLGGDALLKNLRGMLDVGVDRRLIDEALKVGKGFERLPPFRFLAAADHVPTMVSELSDAMVASLAHAPKLEGKTAIVIDVSGSMYGGKVSKNSEMDRAHAACALAAVFREVCRDVRVFATAGYDGRRIHNTQLVDSYRGIALSKHIYGLCHPLGGGGIFIKQVNDWIIKNYGKFDRYVCITDEQDTSGFGPVSSLLKDVSLVGKSNYIMNVGSYDTTVAYDPSWVRIGGFSANAPRFIYELERLIGQRVTQ